MREAEKKSIYFDLNRKTRFSFQSATPCEREAKKKKSKKLNKNIYKSDPV